MMGLWCLETQPRETQAFAEMNETVSYVGAVSSAAWLVKEDHLVCKVFNWLSY